ncbi:MAG: copper chaperone [Dehalococcoidia bacterium]|nr:copper chaperone [Dehalococcoidia bacterium]
MPVMTLFAPDIFCDHCISTIKKATEAIEGARFVQGDPATRLFTVDLPNGAALDALGAALAEEGYPLSDAPSTPAGASEAHPGMTMLGTLMSAPGAAPAMMHGGHAVASGPFHPQYLKIERTEAGADITYSCPCGSTTEVFHLDRGQADHAPHSCCGHHTLVGADAAARLRARLGDGYDIDVQTITMPWGQPLEAAQAVPRAISRG